MTNKPEPISVPSVPSFRKQKTTIPKWQVRVAWAIVASFIGVLIYATTKSNMLLQCLIILVALAIIMISVWSITTLLNYYFDE